MATATITESRHVDVTESQQVDAALPRETAVLRHALTMDALPFAQGVLERATLIE